MQSWTNLWTSEAFQENVIAGVAVSIAEILLVSITFNLIYHSYRHRKQELDWRNARFNLYVLISGIANQLSLTPAGLVSAIEECDFAAIRDRLKHLTETAQGFLIQTAFYTACISPKLTGTVGAFCYDIHFCTMRMRAISQWKHSAELLNHQDKIQLLLYCSDCARLLRLEQKIAFILDHDHRAITRDVLSHRASIIVDRIVEIRQSWSRLLELVPLSETDRQSVLRYCADLVEPQSSS